MVLSLTSLKIDNNFYGACKLVITLLVLKTRFQMENIEKASIYCPLMAGLKTAMFTVMHVMTIALWKLPKCVLEGSKE